MKPEILRPFFGRLAILTFGLFLFSIGIVLTMKASIGYAPWDVFHWGVGRAAGISIGNASILVGLAICLVTVLLGEKLGLGTLLNMVLLGVFMDLILDSGLMPAAKGPVAGLLMMIAGFFVISLGSFFYIKSAFGAGPRDSLMVAIRRLSGLPVGFCRTILEGSAVLVGWLLGGPVGAGTVVSAFGIGLAIQLTFSLLRFEAAKVRHETLADTFRAIRAE